MATRGKRRALGQHFLTNTQVIQAIVKAAITHAGETGTHHLVEIGPGKGALTFPIIGQIKGDASIRSVTLIEKDFQFAEYWKSQMSLMPGSLSVIADDFLNLRDAELPSSFIVISNLPYSASTAIVAKLTEISAQNPTAIPAMVLMFQAEVAERLRAGSQDSDRSAITVFVQNLWKLQSLIRVSPRSFQPPPEVWSEVLIFQRKPQPEITADTDALERLLRTSFARKRKMLRSIFKGNSLYQTALQKSGVDGTKRPEALNWEDWKNLYQALQS